MTLYKQSKEHQKLSLDWRRKMDKIEEVVLLLDHNIHNPDKAESYRNSIYTKAAQICQLFEQGETKGVRSGRPTRLLLKPDKDRLLTLEEKAECRVDWINDKYPTIPDALCSRQDAKTASIIDKDKKEECQARVERIADSLKDKAIPVKMKDGVATLAKPATGVYITLGDYQAFWQALQEGIK